MGIDDFQFRVFSDSRNYAYGPLLGDEYLVDYPGGPDRVAYFWEVLNPAKLKTLLREPIYRHDIKPNGQFVRRGTPSAGDAISRNFNRLPLQVAYLDRILELARAEGIEVFITMLPMRDVERQQYSASQMEEFQNFLAPRLGRSVHSLDFSTDQRFTMADFVDFTHLTQHAADRFTALLNEQIVRLTTGDSAAPDQIRTRSK